MWQERRHINRERELFTGKKCRDTQNAERWSRASAIEEGERCQNTISLTTIRRTSVASARALICLSKNGKNNKKRKI